MWGSFVNANRKLQNTLNMRLRGDKLDCGYFRTALPLSLICCCFRHVTSQAVCCSMCLCCGRTEAFDDSRGSLLPEVSRYTLWWGWTFNTGKYGNKSTCRYYLDLTLKFSFIGHWFLTCQMSLLIVMFFFSMFPLQFCNMCLNNLSNWIEQYW